MSSRKSETKRTSPFPFRTSAMSSSACRARPIPSGCGSLRPTVAARCRGRRRYAIPRELIAATAAASSAPSSTTVSGSSARTGSLSVLASDVCCRGVACTVKESRPPPRGRGCSHLEIAVHRDRRRAAAEREYRSAARLDQQRQADVAAGCRRAGAPSRRGGPPGRPAGSAVRSCRSRRRPRPPTAVATTGRP